jgi:hypothetical protein
MSTGRQEDGRSEGRIDKSDCKNRRTVPLHIEVETCSPALSMGEKCYVYSGSGLAYIVPNLHRSVCLFE